MTWPPQPSRRQTLSRALVTVVLPWRAAIWLFKPRGRIVAEDRAMATLGRNRAILGMATMVLAALRYGDVGKALDPEAAAVHWLVSVGLAVPVLAVCAAVLVLLIPPGQRRPALVQLRWPAYTLLGFLGITVCFLAWNWTGRILIDGLLDTTPLDGFVGLLSLWIIIFWVCSAYLINRHWFNAADGHPLLPPLVATVVTWLAVAVDAVREADNGLPSDVAALLAVGGATVTMCLAAAEWWRLHQRYGISPRSGPWPAHHPPVHHPPVPYP